MLTPFNLLSLETWILLLTTIIIIRSVMLIQKQNKVGKF